MPFWSAQNPGTLTEAALTTQDIATNVPDVIVQVVPAATGVLTKLTPFLSALLGAAIAGTTGFFLQRNQFRNQQKVLNEDRADAEEVAALAVLMGLNRVHTNIVRVRDSIDAGAAKDPSDPLRLWANTLPFSSDLPIVKLSVEDLVFVKRLGDVGCFNNVMDLEAINETYVGNMRVYREMRAALSTNMLALAVPDEVEGSLASASFSEEQMMRLMPEMEALNSLLRTLRAMADEHHDEVLSTFREVQKLTEVRLRDRAPSFALSDEDIAASPTR